MNPLWVDYTATDVDPVEADVLASSNKQVDDYVNNPEPTYLFTDATVRFWWYVFPAEGSSFTHWEMNGVTRAILPAQIGSAADIFNVGTIVVNSITYDLYRSTAEMAMTHNIIFKYSE